MKEFTLMIVADDSSFEDFVIPYDKPFLPRIGEVIVIPQEFLHKDKENDCFTVLYIFHRLASNQIMISVASDAII